MFPYKFIGSILLPELSSIIEEYSRECLWKDELIKRCLNRYVEYIQKDYTLLVWKNSCQLKGYIRDYRIKRVSGRQFYCYSYLREEFSNEEDTNGIWKHMLI